MVKDSKQCPSSSPVNAECLHERLPHSELRVVDVAHFIWEDAAEYAALVNTWWTEGFKTCMKASTPFAAGS